MRIIIATLISLMLSAPVYGQVCGNPHYVKQEDETLKFSCESTRLPKFLFGVAWIVPAIGDVVTTDMGSGREANFILPLWVDKSTTTTVLSNTMMLGMAGLGAKNSYWLWTHDHKRMAVGVTIGVMVLHGWVIHNNMKLIE